MVCECLCVCKKHKHCRPDPALDKQPYERFGNNDCSPEERKTRQFLFMSNGKLIHKEPISKQTVVFIKISWIWWIPGELEGVVFI